MKILLQIVTLFLLLLPDKLLAQKAIDNYTSSSVLSEGIWFRIAVTEDGIYRIDYSKLKQLGLMNPSNPRIFCNNFGQLSYYNNAPKPDDLKELSIFISGSDAILNEGEYLLFYGKGTGRWKYNQLTGEYDYLRHNYSDTAFYFITSGTTEGKRVKTAVEPADLPNFLSSESDALFIHEIETENLIKSGREWFQPISSIRGITINPGFTDLITSEKLKYRIRVAARASVPTIFRLYEGETVKKSLQVQAINLFDYTGTYAGITDSAGSINTASLSPVFEIRFFNNGESGAYGWIDYIKFQGRKSNSFSGTGYAI